MEEKIKQIKKQILENMYPYFDQVEDNKECEESMNNLEQKLNELIKEAGK